MKRLALAATIAAATLLIGCGETTDRATAKVNKEFFGIAPQDEPSAIDFSRMAAGNVGSYHVALSWPRVEQSAGLYNWAAYDSLFAQLAINDIVPVTYAFGTAPHHAPTATTPPTSSPAALNGWASFLQRAAARYGPEGAFWDRFALTNPGVEPKPIEIWEIWNEPNGPAFWAPAPNVGDYAKLLKRSATAIRSVDPGAEIMIGGMFSTPSSESAIKSSKFLKALYRKGGVAKITDAVAIHPYGPEVKDVRKQMQKLLKVMTKAGESRDDVWVTEIGWGSDAAVKSQLTKTPAVQAKLLRKVYKLFLRQRTAWNLRGALWYTWRDPANPIGLCGWCASAGLVDGDLDVKPAWAEFTRLAGGKP